MCEIGLSFHLKSSGIRGCLPMHDDIAVGSKTTDSIMVRRGGRGVINIKKLVGGKIGVKGNAEQATFKHVLDRDDHKLCRQKYVVLDNTYFSVLLKNEEPTIWRKLHGGRLLKLIGDLDIKKIGFLKDDTLCQRNRQWDEQNECDEQ